MNTQTQQCNANNTTTPPHPAALAHNSRIHRLDLPHPHAPSPPPPPPRLHPPPPPRPQRAPPPLLPIPAQHLLRAPKILRLSTPNPQHRLRLIPPLPHHELKPRPPVHSCRGPHPRRRPPANSPRAALHADAARAHDGIAARAAGAGHPDVDELGDVSE